MKRVLQWLLTNDGKKFSYFFAGACASTSLLAHILPHTVFVDQYKDILHLYRDGFTARVPPNLLQTFQKALDMCEIEKQDQSLFKPFMGFGFDVFSIGSAGSRWGVRVGIPVNFTYETVADIAEDKHKITVGEETVHWDTEEGKSLLKSYILSENAKLYAIAREIKFRETPKLYIDTVTSVLVCTGVYSIGNYLNTRLNLYAKPLKVRLCLYGLLGAFGFLNYFMVKDASQVYFEEQIDKELRKNDIFKEGGKEYYGKMCQRNRALRGILGKEGESAFTPTGNENYLIRYRHVPLVQRRLLFE